MSLQPAKAQQQLWKHWTPPADSGPPVAPNTTALPSNPGAARSPAVHEEAPEGLATQKPPDFPAAPEVGKQTVNRHAEDPHEDDVMIEVWEEEMQDLR